MARRRRHDLSVRAIEAINRWLGSPAGFWQAVAITVGWVPLVLLSIDYKGQVYLYVATALSVITQFNVIYKAAQAETAARAAAELTVQGLQNQADMMRLMLSGQDEQDEVLEDVHRSLSRRTRAGTLGFCRYCGAPRADAADQRCPACGVPYVNDRAQITKIAEAVRNIAPAEPDSE